MKDEMWRPIPGYDSIYEVSNLGRIRSSDGKTTVSDRHGIRVWKSRIIKQKYQRRKGNTDHKDARVILWKNKQWKTYLVARLVALAWVDGYQDGMTVNHIDGNPLNNSADNLEWITLRENIQRGFLDGLYSSQQRPCKLVDLNGNTHLFHSLSEANRFLCRSGSYMQNVILHNRKAKSLDGEIYTVFA